MTSPLELLIVLAVVAGLVLFVSAPLRQAARVETGSDELAELEAAREAKLRELRDAELDHRTGKLSDQDYAELDAGLRAEAIEILRQLDRADQGAAVGAADEFDQSLPSAPS
jgi:hypothetical protein